MFNKDNMVKASVGSSIFFYPTELQIPKMMTDITEGAIYVITSIIPFVKKKKHKNKKGI
jgi:hypothetical protein